MPRTSSNSSKSISSTPIRPPTVMGPIFPSAAQPIEKPSFTQNVKDGFSLGIGVSVARNIVDRMFESQNPNAKVIPVEEQHQKIPCKELIATYDKCLMEKPSYECYDMWKDIKVCLGKKEQNGAS
jgi:hypothetical protein